MRLANVLKSTEFEQYIDVFASKGYHTIEELQALESNPEKYIRILSEVESDDLKMMDLFNFLKKASDKLNREKEIRGQELEAKKKRKRRLLFFLLIAIILASAFGNNLYQNYFNDDGIADVASIQDNQHDQSSGAEDEIYTDTDEDGVFDIDDDCVYKYGPEENNGCPWPDSDYDGVIDRDDDCISDYGPEENNGCPWPDSDGDGILDKDDGCISDYGPEENNGCPWSDSDNDGVLDKDDNCVYKYGPKGNNGCPWPDSDNDGVLDKNDNCPYEYGSRYNNGCPKVAAAKHSFKITNRAGRTISFYLKVDGGSWEEKTLSNDYYNTYTYSKSSIKWKLTTTGHSSVIYDINSAEEYVIKWNQSKGVWDLFRL